MRLGSLLGFSFSTLFLIASASGAGNLIVNGDFDQTQLLNGWLETGGKSWEPFDEDGIVGSGSVQITNEAPFAGSVLVRQCVPVIESTPYRAGTSTFVASGQTAAGEARFDLVFFDSPDCSFPKLTFETVGRSSQFDVWERLEGIFDAPPGSQSARVNVGCFKADASGSFECFHDNVFVPEPSSGWLRLAALGSLALLRCGRRRSRE